MFGKGTTTMIVVGLGFKVRPAFSALSDCKGEANEQEFVMNGT